MEGKTDINLEWLVPLKINKQDGAIELLLKKYGIKLPSSCSRTRWLMKQWYNLCSHRYFLVHIFWAGLHFFLFSNPGIPFLCNKICVPVRADIIGSITEISVNCSGDYFGQHGQPSETARTQWDCAS